MWRYNFTHAPGTAARLLFNSQKLSIRLPSQITLISNINETGVHITKHSIANDWEQQNKRLHLLCKIVFQGLIPMAILLLISLMTSGRSFVVSMTKWAPLWNRGRTMRQEENSSKYKMNREGQFNNIFHIRHDLPHVSKVFGHIWNITKFLKN